MDRAYTRGGNNQRERRGMKEKQDSIEEARKRCGMKQSMELNI